jgi:hypothetical protein
MPPRIIPDWGPPRGCKNLAWKYEYYRTIGQFDLKICTDDEPQTKFAGRITDMRSWKTMHLFCDQEGWKSLVPDPTPGGINCSEPGPEIPKFENMEDLAAFMEDMVRKMEDTQNSTQRQDL